MKVGDLVRPKPHDYKTSAPLVEADWVGIVLDFTKDCYGPQRQLIEKGGNPVVYWNTQFHSEAELIDQLEVINESR